MSCKTRVKSACILAGEALPFGFNWVDEFAERWSPNSAFPSLTAIRPSSAELQTGFEYSSSGGQSGPEEPEWPTTLGGTVSDGSITWTAQALSNSSLLERIGTVDWPAVSGFTITPDDALDDPGEQLTVAKIGSATASSTRTEIRVVVTTTAGNIYVGIIKMKVE
jgi:hypothetical protein